ncbi:hypothetical protein MT325_m458L [Paramecium bursaria chlorella virus MT325]|uniref:Uncharacterized protein m458L n=1 Tax=Paramecium bursaria Chlorella virus MT325 TaxID=346932 RepID=A7IUI8_PBCVM|nr:hypothetical protein MT325_m458L [Paramecium bursaria chlorella virus MT325]
MAHRAPSNVRWQDTRIQNVLLRVVCDAVWVPGKIQTPYGTHLWSVRLPSLLQVGFPRLPVDYYHFGIVGVHEGSLGIKGLHRLFPFSLI